MTNCPECDAALITIRMRIGGRDLVFQHCRACESSTWHADEVAVPLDRLLALVRPS
jgi:hypothetical protein